MNKNIAKRRYQESIFILCINHQIDNLAQTFRCGAALTCWFGAFY